MFSCLPFAHFKVCSSPIFFPLNKLFFLRLNAFNYPMFPYQQHLLVTFNLLTALTDLPELH